MVTRAVQKSANGLVWVLIIGASVLAVDQLTKWLAVSHLQGQPPVEVVGDWLQLTFVRNPGAAFSIGTQYTWIFAIAASVVAIGIVVFSRKVTSSLWLVAMGMLLGGAVGNLVDRITQPPGVGQGHVVDWLELPNWPVFNVADMAVVGGAILMVVLSLVGVEPNPAPEPDSETEHDSQPQPDSETKPSKGEPASVVDAKVNVATHTGAGEREDNSAQGSE